MSEINEGLPADWWRRFDDLVARNRAEALDLDGPEHQQLMAMTDELEQWQARRLDLLVELAEVRGTTLAEVLTHPDVTAADRG